MGFPGYEQAEEGLKFAEKLIKGCDLLTKNLEFASDAYAAAQKGGEGAVEVAWEGAKLGVETLQAGIAGAGALAKPFQQSWLLLDASRESSELGTVRDDAKRSSSTSSKRFGEADKRGSEEADKGSPEDKDSDDADEDLKNL